MFKCREFGNNNNHLSVHIFDRLRVVNNEVAIGPEGDFGCFPSILNVPVGNLLIVNTTLFCFGGTYCLYILPCSTISCLVEFFCRHKWRLRSFSHYAKMFLNTLTFSSSSWTLFIGCVETRGIEPLTPALQRRCSTN